MSLSSIDCSYSHHKYHGKYLATTKMLIYISQNLISCDTPKRKELWHFHLFPFPPPPLPREACDDEELLCCIWGFLCVFLPTVACCFVVHVMSAVFLAMCNIMTVCAGMSLCWKGKCIRLIVQH